MYTDPRIFYAKDLDIEHNASIISKNCQYNQRNLYKMHNLYRIIRFGCICGNVFVNFVLTKVTNAKNEFKVLIHVYIDKMLMVC